MTTDPHPLFADLASAAMPADRPLVILAWAQTLDGSVARADGAALSISSPASFRLTHALRAFCDGILVGIGTALADDPRLTVRDVDGDQPQPVVLDTHLRLPANARLLTHPRPPWLLTGPAPAPDRVRQLEASDAMILSLPLAAAGGIDLPAALRALRERGIRTLMVEGGPTVHAAFLRSGLADWVIVTISPRLLGGLPALKPIVSSRRAIPTLNAWRTAAIGPDLLVWGATEP